MLYKNEVTDGVHHAWVRGRVTQHDHMEALVKAVDALIASKTYAQVIRYTDVEMAITPEEMVSNVLAVSKTMVSLTIPTAVVIQPEHLDFWRAYTSIMTGKDIMRGFFVGEGAEARAVEWSRWIAAQYLSHPERLPQT
jgi:hypothetical protein